ncbi:MAG: murein hydrolase activator EnvC family protein [Myxococcota bacterium]
MTLSPPRAVIGLLTVIWLSTAFAEEPQDPRVILTQANEEERSLLNDLQAIDEQLAVLQSEVANMDTKREAILERKSLSEQKLEIARKELYSQKIILSDKIQALYILRKRGVARLIFGAEDPADLRRRMTYLFTIIKAASQIHQDFQKVYDKHKLASDGVEADADALQALEAELQVKQAALQDQRNQKQSFLSEVRGKRDSALRLLAEISQSQYNLQQRLNSTTPSTQSTGNFRDLYGELPWPVNGTLFRRFGRQKDPITGESINSLGIDIQAPFGTPVRVVSHGVVSLAQFIPAYGQTVAVDHGSYSTVYAHLNGIRVKLGQKVKPGSVIGLVGNTGLTDENNGYLLGFEIRYNRTPQDPLPWLMPR